MGDGGKIGQSGWNQWNGICSGEGWDDGILLVISVVFSGSALPKVRRYLESTSTYPIQLLQPVAHLPLQKTQLCPVRLIDHCMTNVNMIDGRTFVEFDLE